MIAKTSDKRMRSLHEAIAYLQGLVVGIESRIKALEDRLNKLEERVNQPVGGLKR